MAWDILHVQSLDVEHAVDAAEVRRALAEGRVRRDDCVRKAGDDRWLRIYEVAEFREVSAATEVLEEPPRIEVGSLRDALAEAEPPQQVTRARPVVPSRRVVPAAPPRERRPAVDAAPAPTAEPVEEKPHEEPMLFMKKKEFVEEEVDMAPAATVSFLLILFFVLVSGAVFQKAIEFPKPGSDDETAVPKSLEDMQRDHIVVRVKGDNSILLDEELTKGADLEAKLSALKRDKAKDDLVIRADENAFHETVVAVLDAANLAGIRNIKLAAPTKSKGSKRKSEKKRSLKT